MIAQHLIRHWLARLLGRHWLALLPLRIIGVSCHPHRGETWLSDQADGAPELPLFTRLQRQLAHAHEPYELSLSELGVAKRSRWIRSICTGA